MDDKKEHGTPARLENIQPALLADRENMAQTAAPGDQDIARDIDNEAARPVDQAYADENVEQGINRDSDDHGVSPRDSYQLDGSNGSAVGTLEDASEGHIEVHSADEQSISPETEAIDSRPEKSAVTKDGSASATAYLQEPSTSNSAGNAAVPGQRTATLSQTLIAAQSIVREQQGTSSDALNPESGLRYPHHRSSQASSIASNATADSATPEPTTIHGVVLVGFNHSLGPIVDYSYPPNLQEDEDIARALPFLALPDGAHMHDEDYSCFHLYLPNISDATVYGISCIRQLRADDLLRKSADVTRSTVQKAVVVLANKPIFGPIRDKLGVITRAFFAQRNFEETEILEHFYYSLVNAVKDEEQTDESAISMGVSVREIVWKFRMQTLTLFKLLLLQKRVMFYSSQVERLCSFQYALVSLVPLLLLNLEDAASPLLDSRLGMMRKASSLRSSDRKSLLAYLGLPLNLFGKGAFFQPYLPLQQLELLQSDSYLVGATNSIFQSQRDCPIDVVVNLETANIEFLNPKVATMVGLTAADRKWMDEIVRTVESTWNPSDPHRPVGMGYKASDDWLRSKFEEYLTSALSAIKFVDFLIRNKDMAILINPNDPSGLGSFNESWLANFRMTPAFETWNKHTDPVIFDLVEPKHPCEGQAHVIEDVGIRLVNGLHDLHLDEKLGPTQEAISKGIATGSEGVWKLYSSVKSDLAKRQAEYRERREREEASKPAAQAGDAEVKEAENERPQLISDQVLAGAAEVGGRAASLATNIGSFFGSRLTKQRSLAQITASDSDTVIIEDKTKVEPASGSAPPADSEGSSSRPRMGLFSSFRNVSGSVPAQAGPSSPQAASKADNSVSLASPPIAASFGSFFRRSSSTPANPTGGISSGTDVSPKASTQLEDYDSGVVALPDDFEDGTLVWSEEKLAFVPSERHAPVKNTHSRNSHSTSSVRSDIGAMSDVKL